MVFVVFRIVSEKFALEFSSQRWYDLSRQWACRWWCSPINGLKYFILQNCEGVHLAQSVRNEAL